jgi:hypothetical protein
MRKTTLCNSKLGALEVFGKVIVYLENPWKRKSSLARVNSAVQHCTDPTHVAEISSAYATTIGTSTPTRECHRVVSTPTMHDDVSS